MDRTIGSRQIIGAYRLKGPEYDRRASNLLLPIQKRGADGKRKKEDWPHKAFAVGSAVYDIMRDAGVLNLYFDPVYRDYKTITMEHFLFMHHSGKLGDLIEHYRWRDHDWIILDENGEEHPRSREAVLAVAGIIKHQQELQQLIRYVTQIATINTTDNG